MVIICFLSRTFLYTTKCVYLYLSIEGGKYRGDLQAHSFRSNYKQQQQAKEDNRKTSKPKLKSSFVKSLLSPGCQEGQKSSPESRETPKQPAVTNLHTSEKPQHPDTPEPGITHTQRHTHQ